MTERLDDGSKCTASMNGEHCQHYYYEGIADDEWHDCSGKGRHCCYCETSPAEREVESREPLEWKEKNHTNGDPYEAHSEGGAYFWAWRKDIVKRPSDKWLLWLGGSAIATVRTLDEAKSLAQKLQDVLDGVPDQARAEGRAEPLAEVVAKHQPVFPTQFIVEFCGVDPNKAHCSTCVIPGSEDEDGDRTHAPWPCQVIEAIATVRELREK